MTKSSVVRKSDYEFYSIPVPLKMSVGKKKRKFLYAELEKRHPCFSGSYTFDYVTKIKKNGLESDVVVLDKLKLAEYKRKYGRTGFLFSEIKKRLFVSEKYRVIKISIFIFALVFAAVFFATIRKFFAIKEISNSYAEIPILSEAVSESEKFFDGEIILPYQSLLDDILAVIKSRNGKIENFEWQVLNGKETVSILVKNIFPEDFTKITDCIYEYSGLTYKDSVPNFFFKGERNISSETVFQGKLSAENEFRISVRKILLNSNAELIEEKISPMEFSFYIKKEKIVFSTILNSLEQIQKESDFSINYINCSEGKSDTLKIRMKIGEKNAAGKNICNAISENLELFGFSDRQEKGKILDEKNQINSGGEKKLEMLNENVRKIGEVTYKDGRKIFYYKNSDGKIIGVENEKK